MICIWLLTTFFFVNDQIATIPRRQCILQYYSFCHFDIVAVCTSSFEIVMEMCIDDADIAYVKALRLIGSFL